MSIGGLDPKDVLKQRVTMKDDEGFAENEEQVIDKEFEKVYNNYMKSDAVAVLDQNETFKKWKDFYNELSIPDKKKFIKYCLIDIITAHTNVIINANQIQQDMFSDDYADEPLDHRWFDMYIYQLGMMALNRYIPIPMYKLINTEGEEDNDE